MGGHKDRKRAKREKSGGRGVAAGIVVKASPCATRSDGGGPEEILPIPIDRIRPFKGQPRKFFPGIPELAESIKAIGQLEAGIVIEIRDDSEHDYELVSGERRFRACKLAGVEFFRATVKPAKDAGQQYVMAAVANLGRADHQPLEIANFLQEMKSNGLAVEQIAKICCRSVPWVYQYLGLLRLVPEVQEMMDPNLPDNHRLVFSLALMISSIVAEKQLAAARYILDNKLGLKRAQHYIRCLVATDPTVTEGERHGPARQYRIFEGTIIRVSEQTRLLIETEEGESQEDCIKKLVEKTCSPQDRMALVEAINSAIGNLQELRRMVKEPFAHGEPKLSHPRLVRNVR